MELEQQTEGRQLPVREIAGISFMVDATEMVLIDRENPGNRLAARNMINSPEGHYFVLDRRDRKIEAFSGRIAADSERFVAVNIPRLEAMDPEGMRMLVEQGKIPLPPSHFDTVSILGTDFYFTDRSNFQQVDNPWNIVPASNFQKNGEELGFWYHMAEKRAALSSEIPSPGIGNGQGGVRFIPILELLGQLRREDYRQQQERGFRHSRRTLGR